MSKAINCIPAQPKTDCTYEYGDAFVHVSPVELPDTPLASTWSKRPSFFNAGYVRIAEEIANLEVRPDDVWVVTFPKSGTTWTMEMVRMIHTDLDYEKASKLKLEDCYDLIEDAMIYQRDEVPHFLKDIAARPSPRYIKTHLPIELLPKAIWTVKPKIVFTSRNPKDTVVSFYHHYRNFQNYKGDLDSFVKVFLADEIIYAPFYEHILNFWNARHEPNFLFLTYEQMKSDMVAVLKKVSKFFGKNYTEEQLDRLSRHLHVDSMKHNPTANNTKLMEHIRVNIGVPIVDSDFK